MQAVHRTKPYLRTYPSAGAAPGVGTRSARKIGHGQHHDLDRKHVSLVTLLILMEDIDYLLSLFLCIGISFKHTGTETHRQSHSMTG